MIIDKAFPQEKAHFLFDEIDLKKIAVPECALEVGKAAEHLVCADLIIQGFKAYLSDQGLSYDVVVDSNGTLHRVQVKASAFRRNILSKGRSENFAYLWNVRKRGKHNKGRLSNTDCDIIALVGIFDHKIAYIPVAACSETVSLRPFAENGKTGYTMDELRSFQKAIDGFPENLSLKGRKAKISREGVVL